MHSFRLNFFPCKLNFLSCMYTNKVASNPQNSWIAPSKFIKSANYKTYEIYEIKNCIGNIYKNDIPRFFRKNKCYFIKIFVPLCSSSVRPPRFHKSADFCYSLFNCEIFVFFVLLRYSVTVGNNFFKL